MDFPYKKYYMNNIYYYYHNLCNYKCKIIVSKNKPKYIVNKLKVFIKDSDNYPVFVSSDETYASIDIITDYFQEEMRVKCNRNNNVSTFDYYTKNKQIIFKELNINDINLKNVYDIREYVYKHSKECTQFKCTLAKSIYEYFAKLLNSDIDVLDPCAGWGDRLIGALSCKKIQHYLAYDPNIKLKKGHDSIIDSFLYSINDIIDNNEINLDKVNIIYEPFEKSQKIIPVDLVFTSPPFYNLEIYDKDSYTQSSNYDNYLSWLKEFLFKLIDLSWSYLKVGGYIAIHISDFKDITICEVMNSYIQCYDFEYCGYISSLANSDILRPIWVHKKLSNNEFDKSKLSYDFKTIYNIIN